MKEKMLFTALLGLLFVGCAKEKAPIEQPDRSSEISFTSAIEATATRAVAVDATVLNDVTFLRMDAAATIPTDFSTAKTFTASRATNGNITFTGTAPQYPMNKDKAYFVAYHPAGTVATNVATLPVTGKSDILLTPVHNAGTYLVPLTGTMTFKHQLAQLEVVCKASATTQEAIVQNVWGNITKIELVGTPTTLTYTYATNKMANGATMGALALLKSDYETALAAVPITKNTANAVMAAGMFAPQSGAAPLKLKIYTTTEPAGKEVQVQLKKGADNKGFEVGMCHKVTLEFNGADKEIKVLTTKIEAWGTGYKGSGSTVPPVYDVIGDFNAITLISNTPMPLPQVTSNRIWTIKGTLPAWLKITKGKVAWAATTAANTITIPAAGYDVAVGSATDLYLVADPNTLGVLGGTTTNGITSATVALTYGNSPINIYWTHSFKNTNTTERPLVWAAGNLVSVNTTAANTAGQGGARIGSMYDGGLYFKFGSLVGLKGGAKGSGVGTAVDTHDTGYWLRPTDNTNTDWANAAYFQGTKTSGEFNAMVADNLTSGVGDACRYYLGAPWRMPTGQEYGDLCNKKYGITTDVNWTGSGGKWTNSTTTPATNLYGGWWDGTAAFTTALANSTYFIGAGHRRNTNGSIGNISSQGVCWSSSIGSADNGLYLNFLAESVYPQYNGSRAYAFPIRCVQ